MNGRWIKNFAELAKTENRKRALEIAEAGLDAINTKKVVTESLALEGNILSVQGKPFDLSTFKKIKVIGFGKASCDAAQALEEVLGSKISEGAVIGLEKKACEFIETFEGTHPRPSPQNLEVGKRIIRIVEGIQADDLVIVIVSGGGSALLCYPEAECEQGRMLYDASIKSGIMISELNTVRKHISSLKGGGLAKMLYPATVISLIFSDVPGDNYADVASGPTYKDETTIADAEKVIKKYDLGSFNLTETPKEDMYFEKVHNNILVSNRTAVDAMAEYAKTLGFSIQVLSYDFYDQIEGVADEFISASSPDTAVLGAGEPKMKVENRGGSGGRNLYLGMTAIGKIPKDSVFVALASDGLDNSAGAGAIVDSLIADKVQSSGIDMKSYAERADAYDFFEKLGDGMIMTGPTGANVSDLMILMTKHD